MATKKAPAKKTPAKKAKPASAPRKKGLTPKQALFVSEYLIDLNATQAYLRAGFKVKPTSARVQACRLLADPNIAAAIEKAIGERGERLQATADDVVREITRLAMFDPKDLTEVKSPQDIAALPEDVRRAIVGWSWDRQGRFTIKLVKEGALEMLGRHHALFKEKVEHTGAGGGPILMEQIAANPRSRLTIK